MKIIRSSELEFVPAGHEDPKNPGVLKKILFKKEDLIHGRIQMINWAKLSDGDFKPHYHEDMDEVFIMVKGNAKVKVDNEEILLNEGDAIVIENGEVHEMIKVDKKAEFIAIGITQEKNGKTVNV